MWCCHNRQIYQSGVLFLGHSFGLPAIVADVGSLKDDIVEGENGFAFKPEDPVDLAKTIEKYFESGLYKDLVTQRKSIRESAAKRPLLGYRRPNNNGSIFGRPAAVVTFRTARSNEIKCISELESFF